MGERRKEIRLKLAVLLGLLLLLIIGFAIYTGYVYVFNHTEREYVSGQQDKVMDVSINPRSGQTDSWTKNVEKGDKVTEYTGTIYDVTLKNIGDSKVSKWKMRINIPKSCYINNAWCGKLDIHQNMKGNEKVQNQLDLREYSENDLKLEYSIMKPDLMIPLYKDDYIIYHPNKGADEYPILSGTDGQANQVVVGMIFYSKDKQPVKLPDYQVKYYLEKNYQQSGIFFTLVLGCFIWIVIFCVFVSVELNMRQAHKRFVQDEHIIRQSIGVFTRFFEAKDTYTNGHSKRVANYSKLIAEKMGLSKDDCRQIYYIALMHDCGKCYIPDEILKKPEKLTDEEFEIIKNHTRRGAEMVKDFTSIAQIKEGVLYHHEHYDGKGYPEGLIGEDIPMVSRIICISDSFDAMNSKRCYRDALTKEKIISELNSNSGKQFDPNIVRIFMELITEDKIVFTKEK